MPLPNKELNYVLFAPVFSGVRVARSLVFSVMFCRSFFVLLVIIISILLRIPASGCPFRIFKLSLCLFCAQWLEVLVLLTLMELCNHHWLNFPFIMIGNISRINVEIKANKLTFHTSVMTQVFLRIRGHRGRDRRVVGFTTTYAISAYHR